MKNEFEPEVGDKIFTDLSFNCPFCDGQAHVSQASGAVLHSLPPCEKYLNLECDDYLREVNVAIVSGGPDAVRRARITDSDEDAGRA